MVHCFQPCQLALDSVYVRTTHPPTVKPQLSLIWLSLSRNRHELPKEVRQLLNSELEKNFRDLAAAIKVLFGRIRLAETRRREWRV
jgi:chromosomal replication initiation ATPase DnaA